MTIYIVDIEAVDTRYTKQWKEHLPKQLMKSTNKDVEYWVALEPESSYE